MGASLSSDPCNTADISNKLSTTIKAINSGQPIVLASQNTSAIQELTARVAAIENILSQFKNGMTLLDKQLADTQTKVDRQIAQLNEITKNVDLPAGSTTQQQINKLAGQYDLLQKIVLPDNSQKRIQFVSYENRFEAADIWKVPGLTNNSSLNWAAYFNWPASALIPFTFVAGTDADPGLAWISGDLLILDPKDIPYFVTLELELVGYVKNSDGGFISDGFGIDIVNNLTAETFASFTRKVKNPRTFKFDFDVTKRLELKVKISQPGTIYFNFFSLRIVATRFA